jgi:HemY protein
MKRLLALLIIGISIALLLSVAVSYDPGYVRISLGNWLIESNFWMMLALNTLVFFAVFTLLNIKRRVATSGRVISSWFGQSAKSRAIANTEKGLISLLEGDWGNANKLLSRSANKSHKPIINYLAAAHASNELGQIKEAEHLLKKAYESTPDSEFAVGIAQAQIQLQQAKFEPCLATLLRLKKQQSNHPFVLKLLKTVYLKLEDWQQLITLIPELNKSAKLDPKSIDEIEMLAWNKLFIQKADETLNRSQQQETATDILASLWQKVPDKLRYNPELLETYSLQLIRLEQSTECEVLLRKVLNKHWHDHLVEIYGTVEGSNLSEQLIHAENWLKERPNNATLLLALGRLSLRNELWGKALEYFEASKRLHESKESLAELCRLNMRMKPSSPDNQGMMNALLGALELPALPLPKAKD